MVPFWGSYHVREDTSRGHPWGEATFGVKMAVVVGLSFKSRIDHWGEPKTLQGTYIIYPIPRLYQEFMLKMMFLFPFGWICEFPGG